MRRFLILISFIILSFSSLSAQDFPPPPGGRGPGPDGDRGQRMKALYVAYITEELKLTEDDAQKFWPVHSQFEGEMRGIDRDLPELEREQSVLNVKKKYQDKFVKVLGKDRTDEFFRKDAEFRKKMVDRLKEMREKRQGGGGNPDKPFRRKDP